jgi:hypothetical protein
MPKQAELKPRSHEELLKAGFAALVKNLGLADAIRFVQSAVPGTGDYTRERSEWLNRLSPAELARLVAQSRVPRKRPRRRG